MFFEKTTWRNFITQFRAVTRQLVKDNEKLIIEHIEWLGKMKELSEEKEMIKKLARMQAQELQEAWDKSIKFERLYNDAEAARKLLTEGVTTQDGDITAISLVKVKDGKEGKPATYSACLFTLDANGTKVITRTLGPDCSKEFALDNAKIAFVEAFDNQRVMQ